jgi:arylsulfatase A-like enzyme/uncharacterized membrane protein YbhN (UPF0104 family)
MRLVLLLAELLALGAASLLAGRLLAPPWRGRVQNALKAWLTLRIFWLLLAHEVRDVDGTPVATGALILRTLQEIDARRFALFCAAAAGIKLVGILASMQRWRLMLRGQRIELPFRHVFGSFLIGRFIGTFLPSTLGLDGYTLYDAARFSGRTVEVTAAKFLEKLIGPIGIFLSFLVALPFGMDLLYEHTEIFATRTAANAAALAGTGVSLAIVGALLTLLWFPGVVRWGILHLPLPGRARLAGVVARVASAATAYRERKLLLLQALGLSFAVHFTTAAMYYFTALAIGAAGAEFWPVVLGSTVQILATVLSPITIAGEGIRELAQLLVLQHMIGPAAAVASAALGFWAAEGLTLFGGLFWWLRPPSYTPAFCRVDGVQVDYAEAARAAASLEPPATGPRATAALPAAPPFAARARLGAACGLGAGVVAGLALALGEALAIASQGFGSEAQVLWYAPLVYAALFGALCALDGVVLAMLPMDAGESRGWTPALALMATLVPVGLAITLFRLRRDVYLEQMPPLPVLAAVLGGFGALALALFFAGPRAFRGALGAVFRPRFALALAILAIGGGWLAAGELARAPSAVAPPAATPALAQRPNVILVMVDTLRADHLSCYGGQSVATPNLCRIAADGGTLYSGFAHASWTKPSAASLLSSLLPSSHQAMAKAAALPAEIDTVAEAFQSTGYATGAFVSNTNLTEAFGFAQGFDEYHYLAPDYLFSALESSSKLVLYQIFRRLWFMAAPGLHPGDFYQDSAVVNGHAFAWLERYRAARFFLFLHYMDPHDPYFVHPYNGEGIARATAQDPPPEQAARMHELYLGEIAYLDANFGRLIERLEALGLYDDALIALVSDHGEEFQEHGGFWHGMTLYDEQVHVPLLVKWPRGAPAAPPDARGEPARLIDVAPTLLARAGAAVPPAMQGIDLARLPAARAPADQLVFAEENHEGNVLRAVRTKTWKWIEANEDNPRGLPTRELFRVASDPAETEDLAAREPGVAQELARQAAALELAAREHRVGAARAAQISQEECEQLKQLGYVEDCGV